MVYEAETWGEEGDSRGWWDGLMVEDVKGEFRRVGAKQQVRLSEKSAFLDQNPLLG
jgi:hypothetical protein